MQYRQLALVLVYTHSVSCYTYNTFISSLLTYFLC